MVYSFLRIIQQLAGIVDDLWFVQNGPSTDKGEALGTKHPIVLKSWLHNYPIIMLMMLTIMYHIRKFIFILNGYI